MKCRSSSDDLGCYEHSGGFNCDLDEGHEGDHLARVIELPDADGRFLYEVVWRQLIKWDSASKSWVEA